MRIKQKPEDFSVKESYRFDEVPEGTHRVYLMDKQKLSTFDAVERIRTKFGLKPGAISYCGLKDKQGRTEQLIAVEGHDVDIQDPDLRLNLLGRTDKPLSAANITSNRFSVTVRSLSEHDIGALNLAVAEVNRLGVINYFDSQRFGGLKHGQGWIAKDLLRGDFETALKNYLAMPSPLDRTEDAKIKQFWSEHWGEWDRRVPFEGVKKYFRILESLRKKPNDYVRAFLQIDKNYRAMQLFAYQSYLWNEGVRRYLQLMLPRESLFPMVYQAGTLLFHRDADAATLDTMRRAKFPLLAPQSTFTDPKIEDAVKWSLGREKLKLEDLRIADAPKLLFFKHEERPIIVFPQKLVIGRVQQDEINRGSLKVNVAFTLPPGAYATLVIKRLFHTSWKEETVADIRAEQNERIQMRIDREEREEREYAERNGLPPPRTRSTTSTGAARPAPAARTGTSRTNSRTDSRTEERAPSPRRPGQERVATGGKKSRFAEPRAVRREKERERLKAEGAVPEGPTGNAALDNLTSARGASTQAPDRSVGFRERQKLAKANKEAARKEKAEKTAKAQAKTRAKKPKGEKRKRE